MFRHPAVEGFFHCGEEALDTVRDTVVQVAVKFVDGQAQGAVGTVAVAVDQVDAFRTRFADFAVLLNLYKSIQIYLNIYT